MIDLNHPVIEKYCSSSFGQLADTLKNEVVLRRIAAGENLFQPGEPADSLYLLLGGILAVRKNIGIGDRTQVVALLNSGTVVGEGALLDDTVRGTIVSAVEDVTVACFSQDTLKELESEYPAVYIHMMKKVVAVISMRLRKNSERLALIL